MTKLDLKDVFFMIPIHSSSRPALRFSVQNHLYQLTCLPFGLSCAPWVFTKTLKPALTLLRELGVTLVAYIDDILVMVETEEKSRDHTEGLLIQILLILSKYNVVCWVDTEADTLCGHQ